MVPARSVVLAGIKHCGKTTLGRLLARHWGVPFLDTDAELEAEFAVRHKRSAGFRDIYRELGEEGFRRLEAEVIDALADGGSVRVIALGGGVVANPFLSPDALRKLGFGVWLDLKPEIAYPRILRRGLPPFLAGSADPEAEFRRICREREPKFRAFAELPFGIETEEPVETVAERLASAIEKEYSK